MNDTDDARKRAAINAMKQTGSFAEATRAAFPHNPKGQRNAVRRWIACDPAFAENMEAGRLEFVGRLETVVAGHALFGWDEPVFQGGAVVGTKKCWDHKLMLRVLQKHDKSWCEQKGLEITGTVNHAVTRGITLTHDDLNLVDEPTQKMLLECLHEIALKKAADRHARGLLDAPS